MNPFKVGGTSGLLVMLSVLCYPTAGMAQVLFSIAFDDPGNAHSAYYANITSHIQAAGARWMQFMNLGGPRNLEVLVGFPDIPRANGGSITTSFVRNNGTYNIWEQGAMGELRTGVDPNGAMPDIQINFGNSYLTSELWFDPNPYARTAQVPIGQTDAMSVMLHELGHALVFNGWRNGTNGSLPGDYASTFDEDVVFDGSNLFFTGPNATSLYGGNVPVTFNNYSHIGNDAPRPGSDLIPDLMNGVVFFRGTRYDISLLDLMIGMDTGAPFVAVPEPATWALLLVTVVVGGRRLARKNRKPESASKPEPVAETG